MHHAATNLFDPAQLPSWKAWSDALTPALASMGGSVGLLKRPAELAPYRAAMEQAFPPLLRELGAAYGQAHTRTLAHLAGSIPGIEPDPDPDGPDAHRLLMAIEEPLMTLVQQVLSAGLLRPLVSAMVAGTRTDDLVPGSDAPADPQKDLRQDIWAQVPANNLVEQILQAALADGPRYYSLKHDVGETLEWLAHDPANAAFWDGWTRESQTLRRRMGRQDDHLSNTLGEMLVKTVRRMPYLPAVTTIARRIAAVKKWDASPDGWGFAGYNACSALKHSFVSLRSPQHDSLFDAFPPMFWHGVAGEVKPSAGLARWIHANQLRTARHDPAGPQAQALVLKTWLRLDKKGIQALEEAMPGCSQQHLGALASVPFLDGYGHRTTLNPLPDALASPQGRWALTAFRQAGAPVSPQALKHDELKAWHQAHPGGIAQVLFALHAKLEATKLRASMAADEQAPDGPSVAPARAPKRL